MKIRCLKCNEIIESKGEHDFKKCKCGSCFIDGGDNYTRIGGNLENIMLVNEDGTEEQMTLEKFKELKRNN